MGFPLRNYRYFNLFKSQFRRETYKVGIKERRFSIKIRYDTTEEINVDSKAEYTA